MYGNSAGEAVAINIESKNIMICGTLISLVPALKSLLENSGAIVTVSAEDAVSLAGRLSAKRYDIVLIIAVGEHERYMDIAGCVRKNCPDAVTVVMAGNITFDEKRRYYAAGVASCLNMPLTIAEIIEFISNEIEFAGRMDKYSGIYEFLHILGFRENLRGYECLLCAVTLALDEPDSLNDITGKLYPEISARLGISTAQAERSLRYISDTLDEKSEFCRMLHITSGSELNNREVITAVADAYVVYMKGKKMM